MTRKALAIAAISLFSLLAPALAQRNAGSDAVTFAQQTEQRVVFNTKTRKYHGINCKWAVKCTKSCITISLSEAKKRGGIPCKICGGR